MLLLIQLICDFVIKNQNILNIKSFCMLIFMKKISKNRKTLLIFNTLIKKKYTLKICNLLLSTIQTLNSTIIKKNKSNFLIN